MIGQCRYGQVPMTMASSGRRPPGPAIGRKVRGMLYSRATAAVDSGRRLQTATISTPSRARRPECAVDACCRRCRSNRFVVLSGHDVGPFAEVSL